MAYSARVRFAGPSTISRQWNWRAVVAVLAGLLLAGRVAAQDPAVPSSHTAAVNGIELHYRTVGAGPPLLLLHGFGWSGEEWDRFIPLLAKDFTLVIPDLRGHGRSSRPKGDFLQRDAAVDILALVELLGLTRIAAVGHSAGANALYLAAVLQPERFASLVVIGAQHEFTESNRRGMQATPRLEELPEPVREAMMRVHPGGREQIDWLLEQFRKLGANRNDLILTPERLSLIRARVMIVVGDREDLDLALAEKGTIAGAALWVVPSQGHFPFWEEFGGSALAAEVFPRMVHDFLVAEPGITPAR